MDKDSKKVTITFTCSPNLVYFNHSIENLENKNEALFCTFQEKRNSIHEKVYKEKLKELLEILTENHVSEIIYYQYKNMKTVA
ncbi:hypothetical protein [Nosocomiicoccus ampullae]|uniref:hypothetical protein n=1 Tax=Nosocomiicoccus ampullae TaxID=489910 RepID=UPI0016110F93|nr:hypothetical protein [Nosocomiicoccus ampullae]